LILLDVDGVLTDNSIYLGNEGNETKRFNVSDGLGIYFAKRSGIEVAFLSGRTSKATKIRGRELGIKELHLGIKDKLKIYEKLKRKLNLRDEEVLYIGDDLLDHEILKKAGVPIGVKNGDKRINRLALYVTKKRGGEGAVREVIDLILENRKINPLRFLR